MSNGKVTYHQQVSYCGKPRCRRCREGVGHGPYWYSYQTVGGRTIRSYVGKHLPAELQASQPETSLSTTAEFADVVVRLYVLGQFRIERRNGQQWQAVTDASLQHQRVRQLLTCLLSSPGRKLGREQVMDMLWPELDVETASARLDKAVHSLRQLLEPGRSRSVTSSLLLTERQLLQLADQSRIWADADAFDALLTQSRTTNDPGQKEQLLGEAMTLYCGDFLPEERQVEWVKPRREALQRNWIGLLLELADLRIAREAITDAIDTLDRLLAIDPTNEAAVQRLMLLLAQSGRRGEAIRIYQRFVATLKQDYNIAPLLETRNVYQTIQRGSAAQAGAQGDPKAAPPLPTAPPAASERSKQDSRPAPTDQPIEREEPSYMQVGRSNQSPLVGRESELESLKRFLLMTEQATRLRLAGQRKTAPIVPMTLETQRRPQCAMLIGDVGIGKTRLAEELGREAKRRGWAIAWTRAYAQESTIPYRLWAEVLRKAMSQGLWQRQELARRPLTYQALSTLLPELQDQLPPSAASTPAVPEQEQIRLWEAVRLLLTAISENTPLYIALDDLQWTDSSSCELLGHLVRQLRGHPIMFVGTFRDTELLVHHPLRSLLNDLQREQAVETFTINPLTNEQIATLVAYLPQPLVQHIQTLVSGNPFFAEELARGVKTQAIEPNQALTLPDTISAVLDLRMGRLSSACQRLLTRAAVLGGSFEFQSLRLMEPGTDEDTILDLLEEGLQTFMLTEEGNGSHITYHFWHPLLVSHLYDSLSAARRTSLHRRASEVLQQLFQGREAEGAAVIVYHLARYGTESAQVVRYAELAGDRAYGLSAYPEAEKHYRLAVEHVGELPASANWDERLHLAYLLERLGECMVVQGNYEEARNVYERVLAIRSQQRDFTSQAESQQEAQLQALLWGEIGRTWYDTGDDAQAQQRFERGEQVLHEAGVVKGTAWARLRFQQSYIYWRAGKYEVALRTAHEALELLEAVLQQQPTLENMFRSTGTQRMLKGDPVDLGRTHKLLAAIAVTSGNSTGSMVNLNAALKIFEHHDCQRDIAWSCCNLGDAHLRRSEHPLAQAILRRSLSIAEQVGDIPLMSIVLGNMGILVARFGDLVEAENWYKRGLKFAEEVNDQVSVTTLLSYLSTVLQEQGKFADAGSCIHRSLKISKDIDIAPCIGFALVVLGQMRIAQAVAIEENFAESAGEMQQEYNNDNYRHFLTRARNVLQRALSFEGLESDIKTEGQLAQAQMSLLLGELETAQQQVMHAMEEARRYELSWLLARSQRLLGDILTAQGQQEEEAAEVHFKQALETFAACGMRLEWARTLYSYGAALLQRDATRATDYQQGLAHLQEARQVFEQCNAALDLHRAQRVLSVYTSRPPRAAQKIVRGRRDGGV